MATIRATAAAATNKGWEMHQLDMKTTFLDGDLEEEVFVTRPPGFVIKGVKLKFPGYIKLCMA